MILPIVVGSCGPGLPGSPVLPAGPYIPWAPGGPGGPGGPIAIFATMTSYIIRRIVSLLRVNELLVIDKLDGY